MTSLYLCSRCGYKNISKSKLKRHLKRKKLCEPLIKDVDPIILDIMDKLECVKCGTYYSSSGNLKKHEKKCDKKSENGIIKKIYDEQEKLNIKIRKDQEKTQKTIDLNVLNIRKEIETLMELKTKELDDLKLKIELDLIPTPTPEPFFKFNEQSLNFMYILKEREFLKSKENIFKLGFTSKGIIVRSNGYPKGSEIYCCLPVPGNPESKAITHFKQKFTHRKDIGNEYFEGNFENMFVELHKSIYGTI